MTDSFLTIIIMNVFSPAELVHQYGNLSTGACKPGYAAAKMTAVFPKLSLLNLTHHLTFKESRHAFGFFVPQSFCYRSPASDRYCYGKASSQRKSTTDCSVQELHFSLAAEFGDELRVM
ncbi:ST3 beta-galactoside alpha-2,3-sialyltransferase 3b isoform X1 [Tachysurus ichikawai]